VEQIVCCTVCDLEMYRVDDDDDDADDVCPGGVHRPAAAAECFR